jgi:hypothetical protein
MYFTAAYTKDIGCRYASIYAAPAATGVTANG